MKLIHYMMFGMLFIMAGILMLFSFWSLEGVAFDKYPTQIYLTTDKEVYHAGDSVLGDKNVCKELGKVTTIEWSLLDTFLRTYPKRMACDRDSYSRQRNALTIEMLSPTLPAGDYHFSGNVIIRLNPIKIITVQLLTNQFNVK